MIELCSIGETKSYRASEFTKEIIYKWEAKTLI